MNLISAFEILLLGHLVGDYLFQTQWMASNKQKRLFPLLVHCAVYTFVILICSVFLLEEPLSAWGILLIFAGHVFLDQGSFVKYWYSRMARCTEPGTRWLKIVYDQIFHLLILYASLYI